MLIIFILVVIRVIKIMLVFRSLQPFLGGVGNDIVVSLLFSCFIDHFTLDLVKMLCVCFIILVVYA